MADELLACENSRPSSLPARVAFREKDATRAGSEEGRLFSQANELFVQLRNALLDVSRQLQSYLSDELLEAIVYWLEQICRYVLVLAGTNPYLNDLFASITSILSRLATCENLLHSSGYNAPVHLSGRPGRPKFDISREQLKYFLFYDLGVQDIADALRIGK